jgi:hypothetical protein
MAPNDKGISAKMSKRSYSQLLQLPAEIRTEIYCLFFQPLIQHAEHKARLICEDARRALEPGALIASLSQPRDSTQSTSPQPAVNVKEFLQLLLVCRLVHQEVFSICYNNVTFHVRKPLDFGNEFLRVAGGHKLSQIRHLEIRLEGIPVGVNGWSSSAPKLSRWNHHQVGMLFEHYPELECLSTLVIKIEKFADRRLARHANLNQYFSMSQDFVAESAWSQNGDTAAMMSRLSHLKLGKDSRRFKRVFTVADDHQIDENDRRSIRTADGRFYCQMNMKRTFIFTLWKTSDREMDPVRNDS